MSWSAFTGILFAIIFRPNQGRGKSFDPVEGKIVEKSSHDATVGDGQLANGGGDKTKAQNSQAGAEQTGASGLPAPKQAEARGQDL